jgi:HEAT repeat protein
MKDIKSNNENKRAAAAIVLAHNYPEKDKTLEVLIELLDDEHWKVRYSAVLGLSEIGPGAREALPKLEALLADPGKVKKDAIIKAIENIKGVGDE